LVWRHEGAADALQPCANFDSHLGDLGVVGELQHGHRIHEAGDEAAVGLLTHDHVARQKQPYIGFCAQHAVRQGRVAGAEDAVGTAVDTELDPHRGVHIDLSQHPEALDLERLDNALDGRIKVAVG
jgi:hypothetical protein